MQVHEQRLDVASIGSLFRRSLEMFIPHLEDEAGNGIGIDNLRLGQRFYVFFSSGTGLTRTSAVRSV